MTDTKLTVLTAITAAQLADILYLVRNPGSSPDSRKIAVGDLLKLIGPSSDGTSAVKITKADGSTSMMEFDTINNRVSLISGVKLKPLSDGTASIVITKADGTTVVLNFDTTNNDFYSAKASWTQTWANLTITGSPTYSGTYRTLGKLVFWQAGITPAGGTTAATSGTTYINNFPFTFAADAVGAISQDSNPTALQGSVHMKSGTTRIYVPTWSANGNYIMMSGVGFI